MARETTSAAAPPSAAAPATAAESAGFKERWAAWEAKGAAHDRAVRRKMAIFAPILLIVAAAVVYTLLR